MAESRKVIHFGIDAGAFPILDALAERGVMPNYQQMVREGGRAELESTTPWYTIPGWVTWMTGVSAERHGLIYWTATGAHDHWERKGDAHRFVSYADIPFPTIFELASAAGVRSASLNMPVTYPPPRIDGVVVSGFLGPLDPELASWPQGFLSRYPHYRIDDHGGPAFDARPGSGPPLDATVGDLTAMEKERHRPFMDLLADDSFRFLSVVYIGADRLCHLAWDEVESITKGEPRTVSERAVEDYYRTLDSLLGDVRAAAPDDLVIVTSDHGQGPPPTRTFAANVWLKQQGWLRLKGGRTRGTARRFTSERLRRRLWRIWRRYRNIPLGSVPLGDWDNTSAYAFLLASHCTVLGIAVRGGPALEDEIAEGLIGLVDEETGIKPVERVLFARDVCEGPGRETYPELIVHLNRNYGPEKSFEGAIFSAVGSSSSGYHETQGILVAAGPNVLRGIHDRASIADITPTLLARLGIAAPNHTNGRVLPWISTAHDLESVTEPVNRAAPVTEGLSEVDEKVIQDRLEELGYL